MNSQFKLASLTLAAVAMLSACGGGSDASSDDPPPARGTLYRNEPPVAGNPHR